MSQKETFTDSTGQGQILEFRFHRESRMRYQAESEEALFENGYELLKKYIDHHEKYQRPRVQELLDYAEGNNHTISVAGRRKEEDMADNRTAHNFGELIASFIEGYLCGNPIKVEYEDEGSEVSEGFKELAAAYNFHQLNRRIIKDAAKTGRAYELSYRSDSDETRTVRLDPRDTFVIFKNNVEESSLLAVRHYRKDQMGDKTKTVEVYTKDEVIVFDYDGDLVEVDRQSHGFGSVPVTEHRCSDEGLGTYETELSLIDLYDASQSDTANYMQDLSDAILAVFGDIGFPDYVQTVDQQIEYLRKMRKARFMNFVPPVNADGSVGNIDARYLYKQYDVSGVEAYKSRIVNDIHKFTHTPDMTDEAFSGTQSGEAMKWKVFGLDQKRVDMQALFEQSMKRRYWLIVAIEQAQGRMMDFDIRKLKIIFTPNLPVDTADTVNNAKSVYGMVSDETALSMLETVTGIDAKTELDRIAKSDQSEPIQMRAGSADGQT